MGDQSSASGSTKTPLWQKVLLMLGGTGFAVGLVIVVVMLFPGLVPGWETGGREFANQTMNVEFHYMDGDLFYLWQYNIRPPEENVLLESYTISWDDDGFRVPEREVDTYPIAALGDSFTEGANVPFPWPDRLAGELNIPVRNYGYRGYSPGHSAAIAEEFLPVEERSWVVYAYFSGNDLSQANSLENELPKRDPFFMLPFIIDRAKDAIDEEVPVPDEQAHYDFPMTVNIGDVSYEMVIADPLIWWQIAPEAGYTGSNAQNEITRSLQQIQAAASPETCFALVFLPAKGQLYYPYVVDDQRQYLRARAQRPTYLYDGYMELRPYDVPAENEAELIAQFDGQYDFIQQLALDNGWHFIDLFAPFQEAAANGELLFYRYDAHWNQAGHDLAAKVIAGYMRNHPECPLELE